MAMEDRGFASMKDRVKQREIASQGGIAAHEKGVAHEWTSDEARNASQKGVRARLLRRQLSEKAAKAEGQEEKKMPVDADG
jgi:hypothetical protein